MDMSFFYDALVYGQMCYESIEFCSVYDFVHVICSRLYFRGFLGYA